MRYLRYTRYNVRYTRYSGRYRRYSGRSIRDPQELSFSWMSFIAGTGSAVTSAAKAILSKKVHTLRDRYMTVT